MHDILTRVVGSIPSVLFRWTGVDSTEEDAMAVDHVPVIKSIGGLKLGRSTKRGAFSNALRRVTTQKKKVTAEESGTLAFRRGGPAGAGMKPGPRSQRNSHRSTSKDYRPKFDYDDDFIKDNYWGTQAPPPTPQSRMDEKFGTNVDDKSIHKHHQMTFVLASYLQLIFNLVIVCVILYALISFALSVRGDIQLKVCSFNRGHLQKKRKG